MINGDDNGDYIRGITGMPEKSGHSANDKFVLRQMHRGMLYEPPSSIAAPFFVAISGRRAYAM